MDELEHPKPHERTVGLDIKTHCSVHKNTPTGRLDYTNLGHGRADLSFGTLVCPACGDNTNLNIEVMFLIDEIPWAEYTARVQRALAEEFGTEVGYNIQSTEEVNEAERGVSGGDGGAGLPRRRLE